MANIFSQDNPFNDLMSTIGDMAMISVAWTVCSIPVVTIGASTSAACEVARELQTGSSKGIFRSFWAAFKRRFPTNLALTAILALFWDSRCSTCGICRSNPATPSRSCMA